LKQKYNDYTALVLTSGGQDSTICLYWTIKNFKKVHAVSFNYGQKHQKEIESAEKICKELKINLKIIDISFLKEITISNLFEGSGDVNKLHPLNKNVPSSFVPYRNALFLTLASCWASTIGAGHLVIGVCETDYSGYADCRDIFIKSMQVSLDLATDFKMNKIVIHTPLMWLTKSEEFKLAEDLGCLETIINDTTTCYNGVEKLNDFGRGCGRCSACRLRKKGFKEFIKKYK
jgi:7-cyano-7-deazaguanine synthase